MALEPGHCPIDHEERTVRPLAGNQRVRWWCPMHPEVIIDQAGAACDRCGGMILQPRVVSFRPAGKVIAVPESAVVDTGTRTVVFVESMPGTFDGVDVILGPRCGDLYPVVRGVEAGQIVAIAGAFLLDAETRLNPSLAAGYFGAGGRESTAEVASPNAAAGGGERRVETSPLDQLPEADRALALRQKICPVTKKALGSMGLGELISGEVSTRRSPPAAAFGRATSAVRLPAARAEIAGGRESTAEVARPNADQGRSACAAAVACSSGSTTRSWTTTRGASA